MYESLYQVLNASAKNKMIYIRIIMHPYGLSADLIISSNHAIEKWTQMPLPHHVKKYLTSCL